MPAVWAEQPSAGAWAPWCRAVSFTRALSPERSSEVRKSPENNRFVTCSGPDGTLGIPVLTAMPVGTATAQGAAAALSSTRGPRLG